MLFLICLVPTLTFAQDEIVEEIKQKYDKISSIHAQLTQVYHWEGFDVTQSFEGRIWLERPNKLRLCFVDDQENHYICCGDTAWLYTPGLKQAILTHHPSEALLQIFNFDHYEMVSTADEGYILELSPKKENPYFEKITLQMEKKTLMIERMVMTDLNGNKTEWLFREIEVNPELSDTLFHFVPPPNVEVIEQ